MSEINSAFINSLLAKAAYAADLHKGQTGGDLADSLKDSLTLSQASFVGSNFEVATAIETPLGSSFDAVVWRGKPGTEYAGHLYISMRGTLGFADLVEDVNLAVNGSARSQLVDMVNWWLRESTPTNQKTIQIKSVSIRDPDGIYEYSFDYAQPVNGTGTITSADLTGIVEVNGHSLGGYLASSFTRLFGSQANVALTSTFNSAGFAVGYLPVFDQLQLLIGPDRGRPAFPGPNDSSQLNYFAEHGFTFTTNDFWFSQVGLRVKLFNEEGIGAPNHSIYKIVDAMAVARAMGMLDQSMSPSTANDILDAAELTPSASLETALDDLRKMIIGRSVAATVVGDQDGNSPSRISLYDNLNDLTVNNASFAELKGKLALSPSFNGEAGRGDFAALASLAIGTTAQFRASDAVAMDLLGQANNDLYQKWNSDLQSFINGADPLDLNFTDDWLISRAAYLQDRSSAYRNDENYLYKPNSTSIVSYDDLATDKSLLVAPSPTATGPWHFVTFGSDLAETLDGGTVSDHLFGMGGNDTIRGGDGFDWIEGGDGSDSLVGGNGRDMLIGGAGTDTVEGGGGIDQVRGGSGIDTFQFSGDWGVDEVVDADGGGALKVEGFESGLPTTNVKVCDGVWRSNDGKVTFTRIANGQGGDDLILSFDGKKGRIVLRDWQSGEFGISLSDTFASPPTTDRSYFGDQRAKIVGKELDQGQGRYHDYRWDLTSWQTDGTLSGGVQQDGFSDGITGSAQRDLITGANGNDQLYGVDGDDLIRGDAGNDLLAGGKGHDWIEGGTGNDFIMSADDLVIQLQVNLDDPLWTPPAGEDLVISGDTWGVTNKNVYYSNPNIPADNASDYIDAGAGNDTATGSQGNDTITGGAGNDQVWGIGGDDALQGGDGDDWVFGDGSPVSPGSVQYCPATLDGADVLNGGAGNDHIIGGGSGDVLFGGDGDDSMHGDDGADQAGWLDPSFHGQDLLDGGAGNDFMEGEGNDDVLFGGAGNDELYGDMYNRNHLFVGDDALYGGDGNDTLDGCDGNDRLDGGRDDDTLYGGAGDDTLIGGLGVDQLYGEEGNDVYVISADPATSNAAGIRSANADPEHPVVAESGDAAYGWANESTDEANSVASNGIESIRDSAGQNIVQVSAGLSSADNNSDGDLTLAVGAVENGQNLKLVNAFFGVIQTLDLSGQTIQLRDWVQENVTTAVNLTTQGAPTPYVFGAGGNDRLLGTSSTNDTLDGGWGNDQIWSYAGNDLLIGAEGNDLLNAGPGNDTIEGGDGDDDLSADTGDDVLDGGAGNDTIEAGGWLGNDQYLFGHGDGQDTVTRASLGASESNSLVIKAGTDASDVVVSRVWRTYYDDNGQQQSGYVDLRVSLLSTGESILFQDFSRNDDPFANGNPLQAIVFADGTSLDLAGICTRAGKGTALDDKLVGFGFAQETLEGYDGNDTVIGSIGDVLLGGNGDDTLDGNAARMEGGAGDDKLSADPYAETIGFGGTGNDRLSGGAAMYGEDGDDYINSEGDILDGGTGNDTIFGGYHSYMTGGEGNDSLTYYGTEGAVEQHATLRGGTGNDSLHGSLYSDIFFDRGDGVDSYLGLSNDSGDADSSQRATLHLGPGIAVSDIKVSLDDSDLVLALGAGDQISLTDYFSDYGNVKRGADAMISVGTLAFSSGESLDIRTWLISGTNTANAMTGTAGNDIMAGYLGPDSIDGGLGDDGLHGGVGDDSLTGGEGNDTLVGYLGRDTLVGGAGDDVYFIDDTDAAINEAAGAGIDTVMYSAIKYFPVTEYTLRANFENLTLVQGTSGITANGNTLDNRITGNGLSNALNGDAGADTLIDDVGNDTLDGGTGADWMGGGAGDDTYVVDVAGDVVSELPGNGTDTVLSSIDWTLASDVENLLLQGTAANGTGNVSANRLTGDAAANQLTGLDGADTLDGGSGNDRLEGGKGADTYVFGSTYGKDTVVEKDGTPDTRDRVDFGTLNRNDVKFVHNGDDLEARIIGASDKLVIKDWYLGTQYRVEDFVFADGTWTGDQVAPAMNLLVGAMARFGARWDNETGYDTAHYDHREYALPLDLIHRVALL